MMASLKENCPDPNYNGTSYGCPHKFNCSAMGYEDKVSIGIGPIPTYLSIVSCSLSCIGSVLIFLTFCCIKDVRKYGTQWIITFLALADFMQAFGYLLGAWNYLTHYDLEPNDPNYYHKCEDIFQNVCKAQSFVTSWASISSFYWTCALAFEFFFALSGKNSWTGRRWQFVTGSIVAWVVPLIIVINLLVLNKLGYAPYAAANWCFVKSNAGNGLQYKEILIVLFNGKLWEILTYIVVLVMYCVTRKRLKNKLQTVNNNIQKTEQNMEAQNRLKEVNNRLLLIPIVFLFLRVWGTIQFFFSIGVTNQNVCGCIPNIIHKVFFGLGILQAIGDGGQGWGNALLYIFISPTIRQQLISDPFMSSLGCVGKAFQRAGSRMETAAFEYNSRSAVSRSGLSKVPILHTAVSDVAQHAPPPLSETPEPAPPLEESQSLTASYEKPQNYGALKQ